MSPNPHHDPNRILREQQVKFTRAPPEKAQTSNPKAQCLTCCIHDHTSICNATYGSLKVLGVLNEVVHVALAESVLSFMVNDLRLDRGISTLALD